MINLWIKLKIVCLSIKNKIPLILGKIFTQSNLNKVIIIFTVGFVSRAFIVNIYDVNVYSQYLDKISLIYYSCFSLFIVIVHELINFYNINIIPSFFLEFSSYLYSLVRIIFNLNKLIFSLDISDFKISSIRENFKLYLNGYLNKMVMVIDIPDKENLEEKTTGNKLDNYLVKKNSHTLKSSRGRNINGQNTSNNSSVSYSSRTNRPRDINVGFIVESVRDSVASARGEPPIPVRSPELVNTSTTYDSHNPEIPAAPNPTNLSTPSISTLSSIDSARYGALKDAHNSNYTYTPVANYPTTNPSQTYYTRSNTYDSAKYDHGHDYPVPGEVPYFNPARVSSETTRRTIGLNASNEDMWQRNNGSGSIDWNQHNNEVERQKASNEDMWQRNNGSGSVDWNKQRYDIEREMTAKYREGTRWYSDKEAISPTMGNELVVHKKGLMGKLKVAFNFGNNDRVHNEASNVNSIFVKYRDITRRKFVWKVWEKNSGNYESYEDFKTSWNPNTSIWEEIKKRTKRDVQVDIEGVLGINRNIRGLGYNTRNGLGTSNVRSEVTNLVRDRQPFSNTIEHSGPANESSTQKHSSKHHTHKHHTHKHLTHKHHTHKHSTNSRSHSHSHNRSHSPSQSPRHNHRHNHSHSHDSSHTRNNHSNHTSRRNGGIRSPSQDRYI